MIFVTVGTTHFDRLIKSVDELVGKGAILEPVTCQIGSGQYIPKYCEYFRFNRSLDDWLSRASLVICHGGSSVFHLLIMGKLFVAVANTDLADDHQTKLLKDLEKSIPLLWTNHLQELEKLILASKKFIPQQLDGGGIGEDLDLFIRSIINSD
ncbi:MAG TPA: PssE/Cps14G family polysaccharide biosynthesis glycosyltransferase [Syntrophomonadaceae bacterium]|nr:hypothetical protein [Gammaproteobacteria bacterium]HRX22429.1 PssE/Cps14G family polysaccharide biosynthesis glycosyltransferase [Syntrophomonadaceae bacterium]